MLETIANNKLRIMAGNILSSEIINNKYVFISFWSIIHLISGAIIYRVLGYFTKNNSHRFLALLGILTLYEIIEFWAYNNITFFISESIIDVTWDLVVGFLGGLIVFILEKRKLYKL